MIKVKVHKDGDEVWSHQCPLLWTWVLEKMGMLEIVERLTNKQHGDTRFTQVQAPGGKTLLLLDCSDYGGTEGYRGAQMQSGVEVCIRWYASDCKRDSSSRPPGL